MKWKRGQKSQYVEDRRGASPTRTRRPGRGRGKLATSGVSGVVIIVVALLYQSGILKPSNNSKGSGSSAQSSSAGSQSVPSQSDDDTVLKNDELTDFLTFLINDVNQVWEGKFDAELELGFRPAMLVIFEGTTDSRCGPLNARIGPAYCPADKKMYVPPSFFRELKEGLGAGGDFAQAIVLAHELGHHVQTLTGISARMYKEAGRNKEKKRELKIRHELQADCFAGLWAHAARSRDLLEEGDLEEALTAAAAIGDDSLQRMAGQRVDESKWSHGSAEQRKRWFRKGYSSGRFETCDTFAVRSP